MRVFGSTVDAIFALEETQRSFEPLIGNRVPAVCWTELHSLVILFFIAAKLTELGPNVMAVDVAALAITGILAGLSLALGLMPLRRMG